MDKCVVAPETEARGCSRHACQQLSDVGKDVVARRAARALLLDKYGRLVLIKRTRPGLELYRMSPRPVWSPRTRASSTPCTRELSEELGATAKIVRQALLNSQQWEDGIPVHHVMRARVVTMDLALRHVPEFIDPGRGRYDADLVDLRVEQAVEAVGPMPAELKAFIIANGEVCYRHGRRPTAPIT